MRGGRNVAEREGRDVAQLDSVGISRTWLLEKLKENALNALKQERGSSIANRALELIGKEIGTADIDPRAHDHNFLAVLVERDKRALVRDQLRGAPALGKSESPAPCTLAHRKIGKGPAARGERNGGRASPAHDPEIAGAGVPRLRRALRGDEPVWMRE